MKKLLVIVLCFILVLSFVGCSKNGDSTDNLLKSLKNEEINGIAITYEDSKAVIIPMNDSVNAEKLDTQVVEIGEQENAVTLKFTLIGYMKDVKISYIENMGATPVEKEIKELKNSVVNIKSLMSTDMSVVRVEGKVKVGEDSYKDISFALDDQRDLSAYDVLIFK